MMNEANVDYSLIREDYEFFLNHSTETTAQIAALGRSFTPPPATMLDFGCGTGAFTAALLTRWPAPAMHLVLVEPVDAHREEAVERLRPMVRKVSDHASMNGEGQHEMIIANHCLYYVSNLEVALRDLLARRAPGGRLILALLDRRNALARIWQAGFREIGAAFPFPLAEDAEAALARLGQRARREVIAYRIDFPDDPANRRKVLRLLFGRHLARLTDARALALFDAHVRVNRIVIDTEYPHLIVGGTRNSGTAG